jgi:tRNA(fMet)-specific endonuclease VapC
MAYLLDTNIVSYSLENKYNIRQKLEIKKFQGIDIYISCITYFEIQRGLLDIKSAKKQLIIKGFKQFCHDYQIILLDDLDILEKASEIYANLKSRGLIIQTEDILIAATAIVKNLILVSNDSDLSRIDQLNIENWVVDKI